MVVCDSVRWSAIVRSPTVRLSSFESVSSKCPIPTTCTSAITAVSSSSPICAQTPSNARRVETRPKCPLFVYLTLASSFSKSSCRCRSRRG